MMERTGSQQCVHRYLVFADASVDASAVFGQPTTLHRLIAYVNLANNQATVTTLIARGVR